MALPAFVTRVASNLEDQPLADLLRLSSVMFEHFRQVFLEISRSDPRSRDEVDAVLKPFVRELMKRAIELETLPPSRGNA